MTLPDPMAFASEWCSAWNAHDLDRVLLPFSDDICFSSPVAARLVPASGGTINGKAALRAYWAHGLAAIPDLHFEILQVFAGIDTLVIRYRNQRGAEGCEVLTFSGGRVVRGHGTYAMTAD